MACGAVGCLVIIMSGAYALIVSACRSADWRRGLQQLAFTPGLAHAPSKVTLGGIQELFASNQG